jgi:uncharacterized membrane protein
VTQHRPLLHWRYTLFLLACALASPLLLIFSPALGIMGGFDIAALLFIATLPPLFHRDEQSMREHARANDANRHMMLLITGLVMMAILVTIATELTQKTSPSGLVIALVLATLTIAWLFSNIVYALHYASLYYSGGEDGNDRGGINFPDDRPPDYWDFTYFSFTLGMTFQTSDVEISSPQIRRIVLFHCLAAFIFNLGILAFTINVLGGN